MLQVLSTTTRKSSGLFRTQRDELNAIAPSPSSVLLADPDDRSTERMVLIEFKRCPHGLKTALGKSKALQQCRQALDDAGFNWKLPNGDMVFVPPVESLCNPHSPVSRHDPAVTEVSYCKNCNCSFSC